MVFLNLSLDLGNFNYYSDTFNFIRILGINVIPYLIFQELGNILSRILPRVRRLESLLEGDVRRKEP